MPKNPASGSGETSQPLPQHPLVGRLKPDPAQPAQQVIELAGLPGDSDRAGYQRLYLTAQLDYYAEFQTQDVVYSETVAADASPVAGQEATKVGIRRDATIAYTWVRSPRPVDEFDLDVRLGGAAAARPAIPEITATACGVCTEARTCVTCAGTCTCHTDCGTCATCEGQNTCPNTQCNTCAGTCTCNTQCGQATCATCHTDCGTCATCQGQNTCPVTQCPAGCVLPTRVCTHVGIDC